VSTADDRHAPHGSGEPLLFTGGDISKTDVPRVRISRRQAQTAVQAALAIAPPAGYALTGWLAPAGRSPAWRILSSPLAEDS